MKSTKKPTAKRKLAETDELYKGAMASKRTAKALGLTEVIRPRRNINISPVPKPLHNKNLRIQLGKNNWRLLKAELQKDREPVCESCGKTFDSFNDLDGHEEWSYHLKPKVSVASLETISFVCKLCHAAEHILNLISRKMSGEASQAELDAVIAHYCRVNDVSREEFDDDLGVAIAQWKALSSLTWNVDFGAPGEYAGLLDAERRLRRMAGTPRQKK